MNLEIAVLKEQKANLQTTLERTEDQAKESSKAAREKLITITADFEKQLAQQEAHHICLYQLEEQRRNQVEKDLVSAKNAVIILEERLRTVDGELEELKERLDERKGLSSSQLQEVASLKARVRELEGINIGLIQREKVIDARYKEGDLVCPFHFIYCFS
jgi:chromosome segregation ATPase